MIDTRFIKSAKDTANAVKRSGIQFMKQHPRKATSAAVATLLAPALLQNENRDYAQTAAFTTPLVGAVSYAVGKAGPSMADNVRRLVSMPRAHRTWKQSVHSTEVSYADMMVAARAEEQQMIALEMIRKSNKSYYSGKRRGAPDIAREGEALRSLVSDKLKGESAIRYFSNAVHAERLRSLSAADLVKWRDSLGSAEDQAWNTAMSPLPKRAPLLHPNEIRDIINGQISLGNHKFIKGMSSRLQRMDRFFDAGGSMGRSEKLKKQSRFTKDTAWKDSVYAQDLIERTRPDLYEAIQKSFKSGYVQPEHLMLKNSEDGLVGFMLPNGKKKRGLWIPLVGDDQSINTGGRHYSRRGVSQKVYTQDRMLKSDVYAFEALSQNIGPKLVNEELKRFNMYGLVDTSMDNFGIVNPEWGEYVQHNGSKVLRQYQAKPSHLFGFTHEKINRNGEKTSSVVGFKDLSPSEQTQAIVDAADRFDLSKVGSEAGAYQGTLEARHLEDLSLNASLAKQNSTWRAVTKGVHISDTDRSARSLYTSRDKLNPFFETTKLAEEGVINHGIGLRSTSISPLEVTLFGDMPDIREPAREIYSELFEAEKLARASRKQRMTRDVVKNLRIKSTRMAFDQAGYSEHALDLMAKDGMDQAAASAAWDSTVEFLSDSRNFRAMQKAGRIGEGDVLGAKNLHGLSVERMVRYDMHEIAIKQEDLERLVGTGTSIEEYFGLENKDTILGHRNGNPITAHGHRNYIESIENMDDEDDLMGVFVREAKDNSTGTKLNSGSVKGIKQDFDRFGDEDRFRSGINQLREARGDFGLIPNEADLFVSQVYNANKGSEHLDNAASIVGDSLRRIQEQGQLDEFLDSEAQGGWGSRLNELGFEFDRDAGTLRWNTQATKMAKEERVLAQTRLIEDLLADVGARIRNGQLKADAFMQQYAKTSPNTSWMDFVHRYANPETVHATADMIWDSPTHTKFAYYTGQHLSNRNLHGVLGEITERLEYDGDTSMTKELLNHLNGEGQGITRRMTLEEALGGRPLKGLSSAEDRAGTIFDPGHENAQSNFLLEMPDGNTVPVLGHDAYGGKVNRFGTGEFSASDTEKALFDYINAHRGNETKGVIAAKHQAYLDALKPHVHGKESFYRSGPVDPMAQTLRFNTRASELKYLDGSHNPFQIAIGKDTMAKIRHKETREALLRGEDVFAMVTREPVSSTPLMRVVLDRSLTGTNGMGVDEGVRHMMMADADGDYMNLHVLEVDGIAHHEAKAEVFNPMSVQAQTARTQQNLTGIGDETRKLVGEAAGGYKSLSSRVAAAKMYSVGEALKKRSTAASIGSGSNLYSTMLAALEENRNITTPALRDELQMFFFQTIKQGPISAAKLGGGQDMDFARALGINQAIKKSMAPGGSFEGLYGGLRELSRSLDGNESEVFQTYLSKNRGLLEDFHRGADLETVQRSVAAMTTPKAEAATSKILGMSNEAYAYAQAASTTAEELAASTSTFATVSAEALGAMNQASSAAKSIAHDLRGSGIGKVLAAGAAAAVVAGIATTSMRRPVASFGRSSGAKYRPEEQHPGVDQVPGAGPAGSRAPGRPARNVMPAPAQTRTAVVAPLGETRDLDVRMRAADKQKAHNAAKLITRMTTTGDSNVTVNYRDQMKPGSLRTRQKMRDAVQG